MMRMALKTALVVDNNPAAHEIIAVGLQRGGFSLLSAHNVEAANRLIRQVRVDLILLDRTLPGQSGVSFARELRNRHHTKHTPIIMITAKSTQMDIIAGLEVGADDHVTKPFSVNELLARIRAVLRRRAPELTNDVAVVGPLKLDPASGRVSVAIDNAEELLELDPTEFRLLHYLMAHPERVHTRTQILDKVRGHHTFVEDRTVDVYIKRLRTRLARVNLSGTIQTVRGSGYRLSTEFFNNGGVPQPAPTPCRTLLNESDKLVDERRQRTSNSSSFASILAS